MKKIFSSFAYGFFVVSFCACIYATEEYDGYIESSPSPSLHWHYEKTRNVFGQSKLCGRYVVFNPCVIGQKYRLDSGTSYFFIKNEQYGDEDQLTHCVYKENDRFYILRHYHTHVSINPIPDRNVSPVYKISCYAKSPWFFKIDGVSAEGIYEFVENQLCRVGEDFKKTNDTIPFDGIREAHDLWDSDPQGPIDDLLYHVGYNSVIKELNLLPFGLNDNLRTNLAESLSKRLSLIPDAGGVKILRVDFYLGGFDFQGFNLDELEMRANSGVLHQLSGEQYEQLGGGNRMHLTFSYQHAPDRDWLWVINDNGKNRTIVVTEKQSVLDRTDKLMAFDSSLLERLCQREVPLANAKYLHALIFDPATAPTFAGLLPASLTKDSAYSICLYIEAAKENNTIYKRLADIYEFDIGILPNRSNGETARFYRKQVPRWFTDNLSTVHINIPINISTLISERINPGGVA